MQVSIRKAISLFERYSLRFIESHLQNAPLTPMAWMLHGAPGIGKSAIPKAVKKSLEALLNESIPGFGEIGFVDERLANFESADVSGIPYVSRAGEATEKMKFSVPDWLPTQEKVDAGEFPRFGFLVLDELSNASTATQHAAYRLILDREAHHGVKLAEGWIVIAAGNRRQDKTGANDLKPALANRFAVHLEIENSVEDWTVWALQNGIDDRVVSFVNAHPQLLHNFDPAAAGKSAFPTHRTWEFASDWVKCNYDPEDRVIMVSGCVGAAAGTQFESHLRYYQSLPDWRAVMSGSVNYLIPSAEDRGLRMVIAFALVSKFMTKDITESAVKNLERVLVQLPEEFIGFVYRQIKTTDAAAFKRTFSLTLDTFRRVAPLIA